MALTYVNKVYFIPLPRQPDYGTTSTHENFYLGVSMIKALLLLAGGIFIMGTTQAQAEDMAVNPKVEMEVSSGGTVTIELLPELAPKHVERITTLANDGFYDGIIFHRVIDGFMAQTGDPTGTGRGGSELPDLPAEFSDADFGRGTVGMARSASPDSGNSQFFICFESCSFLNGQYTVFGQVVSGMEHIDAVQRGEPPASPDKIVSMKVVEIVDAAEEDASDAVAEDAMEGEELNAAE